LGPNRWQLFDLLADPGEIHDLSEQKPDKLKELQDHWVEYVAETGLIECSPEMSSLAGGEDSKIYHRTKIPELD
ncbi:hypothetical protein WICPIJ_007034, partial [Wickerhamomyces pijperi]